MLVGIIIWFVIGLIGSFLFLLDCYKEYKIQNTRNSLDGEDFGIGLFLFFTGPFGFIAMIFILLTEVFSKSKIADKLSDLFEKMFDKIFKRNEAGEN